MSIQTAWQGLFDFLPERPIVVEPSDAPLTSDAGLLPIRQFDEQLAFTQQFASAIDDPRDPALIQHTIIDLVPAQDYGILADYVDQNDHGVLRHGRTFRLLTGRLPNGDNLASQPTLSRYATSRVSGIKPAVGRIRVG
jgi:hypothetical protein